ncbi:YqfO family protein [Psychrobacter sp. I-STPA6b]|uniref:Nif3-like dinuclear metal center hexameric protein n=1 Tax=Psychrobacter sp. I-STPA6b TaxID=2585718 RepID=UPI001D0C7EDF|nr:YqfO family protein [Psychrobacter sp. I-STPA6b]
MYKLTVFIPNSHLEAVKTALFSAGAGTIGNYSHCCWQVQGTGQFKPLSGSQPHIGQHNEIEQVAEWRVEMVVANNKIHAVIAALKQAHPYETPAYDVIQMLDI